MTRPFSYTFPAQNATISVPGSLQAVSWDGPRPATIFANGSKVELQLRGAYVITAALRVEGAFGVTGFRSRILFPGDGGNFGSISFWDPGALGVGEYRTLRLSCAFQYTNSRGGITVEFTSDGAAGFLLGPDSFFSIAFLG